MNEGQRIIRFRRKSERKGWSILETFMKEVGPEWRKGKEDSVLRNQHEQREGRL